MRRTALQLLALVAIVPLVVLTLTSFVKISVVLSLVRNAIGAPDAPSGLVVTGLVAGADVLRDGAGRDRHGARGREPQPAAPAPGSGARIPIDEACGARAGGVSAAGRCGRARPRAAARVPERSTRRAKDRATFVELAGKLGHDVHGDELWVLAPAFVTTELREAFAIAIADLHAVPRDRSRRRARRSRRSGSQSTIPQTIALPLKLLLFVAVDGWRLLLDSLLRGYA